MNGTLFFFKYKVCWKSIKTETVFIEIEMNKEWNFLENGPLPVQQVTLTSFLLVETPLELLF